MLLNNKKALITGIASNRSIAYGIAKKLSENGAQLCLTYQNDNLKKRVDNVSQELQNNTLTYPCDLSSDDSSLALLYFSLRFAKNFSSEAASESCLCKYALLTPPHAL